MIGPRNAQAMANVTLRTFPLTYTDVLPSDSPSSKVMAKLSNLRQVAKEYGWTRAFAVFSFSLTVLATVDGIPRFQQLDFKLNVADTGKSWEEPLSDLERKHNAASHIPTKMFLQKVLCSVEDLRELLREERDSWDA